MFFLKIIVILCLVCAPLVLQALCFSRGFKSKDVALLFFYYVFSHML